jgi:hypothetical protein
MGGEGVRVEREWRWRVEDMSSGGSSVNVTRCGL